MCFLEIFIQECPWYLVLSILFKCYFLLSILISWLTSMFIIFSEILSSGDVAALVYLWNPLTIITCLGLSTSPVENLFIVLSLYGAIASKQLTAVHLFYLYFIGFEYYRVSMDLFFHFFLEFIKICLKSNHSITMISRIGSIFSTWSN